MPVPKSGLDLEAWVDSLPQERGNDSEFNLLIYRFKSFYNEVKEYQRLHSNCSASLSRSDPVTGADKVAAESKLKLDVSSSSQATNISIQSANSSKNGTTSIGPSDSHDEQIKCLSTSSMEPQATSQPQKLNGQHVINLRKKFLQNQDCGLPPPTHSNTTARPPHKILLQNFAGRSMDSSRVQHYNSSHNLVSLNLNSSANGQFGSPTSSVKPEIKQRSQSGSNNRLLMSKSTERLDNINNNVDLGDSSLENSLDLSNQLNNVSQTRRVSDRDSRLMQTDDNIYDAVSPDGEAPSGLPRKSNSGSTRVLPSAPDFSLASLTSNNRMYPNLARAPPISIELTRPSREDTHILPPPVSIVTNNNQHHHVASSNQDHEQSSNSFSSSVMLGETSLQNTSSSLSLIPRDQEYGNYVNIDFFLKRSKSPSFDDLDEKAHSSHGGTSDSEDDDTTQMSNSYSNSQLCDDSLKDLSPRELAKKLSSKMEQDNSSSSLTPASSGDFLDDSRSPTAFQTVTSTFSKHIDINSKYGSFFTGNGNGDLSNIQARCSTTPRESTSSRISLTGQGGPNALGLIHENHLTATSPRQSLSRESSQIYSDSFALNEAHTSMRSFLSDLKLSPVDDVFEDKAQRSIVKESFAVESCGRRKLRHLFLFNDVIVCAKYQASSKQKFTFDVKWYLNLNGVTVSDINDIGQQLKMDKEAVENQILAIRTNLMLLRGRMQQIKRSKDKRPSKIIKKLKKKRTELEAELVLLLPHLPLVIKHVNGKKFLFFLSSNFDRNQWIESIKHLQSQLPPSTKSSSSSPSSSELQAWIQTCRKNLNPSLGTFLLRSNCDDDLLYGDLFINLSTVSGLPKPGHYYFCFEVDSYGHFSQKASSVVLRMMTTDQDLNEEYVLPLDGAHTLRILLYEDMGQSAKPSVIGKAHVELSRAWFFDKPVERVVEFSPGCRSLVRLSYSSLELLSMRIPHAKLCPTFGLDITQVCKKEKTTVPMLVQLCVNEVERRGMREVGIYRMSGTSTDIQRLKKAFETNPYVAELLLRDIDINSVTGFLKTYLREMPEGLFINKLYVKFVDAFKIPQSDSAERTKKMLELFHKIPLTNQHTIIYLVEHLVKVNKYELHNKMSLTNLATVLGPNILRPPIDTPGNDSSDPFTAVVIGSMSQAGILYFFLNRKATNLPLTELDVSELEQIRATSEA